MSYAKHWRGKTKPADTVFEKLAAVEAELVNPGVHVYKVRVRSAAEGTACARARFVLERTSLTGKDDLIEVTTAADIKSVIKELSLYPKHLAAKAKREKDYAAVKLELDALAPPVWADSPDIPLASDPGKCITAIAKAAHEPSDPFHFRSVLDFGDAMVYSDGTFLVYYKTVGAPRTEAMARPLGSTIGEPLNYVTTRSVRRFLTQAQAPQVGKTVRFTAEWIRVAAKACELGAAVVFVANSSDNPPAVVSNNLLTPCVAAFNADLLKKLVAGLKKTEFLYLTPTKCHDPAGVVLSNGLRGIAMPRRVP